MGFPYLIFAGQVLNVNLRLSPPSIVTECLFDLTMISLVIGDIPKCVHSLRLCALLLTGRPQHRSCIRRDIRCPTQKTIPGLRWFVIQHAPCDCPSPVSLPPLGPPPSQFFYAIPYFTLHHGLSRAYID